MLKIREDFNIKELEKYNIYPKYECDEMTGETRVKSLNVDYWNFRKLKFIKKTKRICCLTRKNANALVLAINDYSDELIDLDTLYDLIKADIVIKE